MNHYQSELSRAISSLIDPASETITFAGHGQLVWTRPASTEEFMASFKRVLGKAGNALDRTDEDAIKELMRLDRFNQVQNYSRHDLSNEQKMISIKVVLKLKGSATAGICLDYAIIYAKADFSKEWFWRSWKKDKVIEAIQHQFTKLEDEMMGHALLATEPLMENNDAVNNRIENEN